MNINNKYAPWVRMITADAAPGGAAPDGTVPASEVTPAADGETSSAQQPAESGDSDEDADPDGRGGKRAVLADLARERDKRQSLQADLDAERKRSAELEGELTTERQQAWAREALASVGLPSRWRIVSEAHLWRKSRPMRKRLRQRWDMTAHRWILAKAKALRLSRSPTNGEQFRTSGYGVFGVVISSGKVSG